MAGSATRLFSEPNRTSEIAGSFRTIAGEESLEIETFYIDYLAAANRTAVDLSYLLNELLHIFNEEDIHVVTVTVDEKNFGFDCSIRPTESTNPEVIISLGTFLLIDQGTNANLANSIVLRQNFERWFLTSELERQPTFLRDVSYLFNPTTRSVVNDDEISSFTHLWPYLTDNSDVWCLLEATANMSLLFMCLHELGHHYSRHAQNNRDMVYIVKKSHIPVDFSNSSDGVELLLYDDELTKSEYEKSMMLQREFEADWFAVQNFLTMLNRLDSKRAFTREGGVPENIWGYLQFVSINTCVFFDAVFKGVESGDWEYQYDCYSRYSCILTAANYWPMLATILERILGSFGGEVEFDKIDQLQRAHKFALSVWDLDQLFSLCNIPQLLGDDKNFDLVYNEAQNELVFLTNEETKRSICIFVSEILKSDCVNLYASEVEKFPGISAQAIAKSHSLVEVLTANVKARLTGKDASPEAAAMAQMRDSWPTFISNLSLLELHKNAQFVREMGEEKMSSYYERMWKYAETGVSHAGFVDKS